MRKTIGFEELPFEDFKKIGFDRSQVLQLKQELIYLMTFRRTNLLEIKHPNRNQTLMAKLSLEMNDGQVVQLLIHPVLNRMKNSFNLNQNEVRKIRDGGVIIQEELVGDKENVYVIQRDNDTNEMLRLDLSAINIDFSEKQMKQLKAKGNVDLVGEKLIIDLSKPEGFILIPNESDIDND
ncbi:MAG: DUF4099 domain-containing protein [Bacteroidota bacterium]